MRRLRTALLACAIAGGGAGAAAGQDISATVDVALDRSTWHFDNPSSHGGGLVPHFFEQHYVLDNAWLGVRAQYRAGVDWTTHVSATPVRQARATDYDTFFDADGAVTVIGTTGDARMHAFRLDQGLELGRHGPVRLSGGYRVRVDRADFLAGDRTETRNGVLVTRRLITTREYTNGQTHEAYLRAERRWDAGPNWSVIARGEAASAVHRLAIQLPDKYPGETLVYRTAGVTTGGSLALRASARWPLTVAAIGVRSWNYRSTQWVRRSVLAATISVGRAW